MKRTIKIVLFFVLACLITIPTVGSAYSQTYVDNGVAIGEYLTYKTFGPGSVSTGTEDQYGQTIRYFEAEPDVDAYFMGWVLVGADDAISYSSDASLEFVEDDMTEKFLAVAVFAAVFGRDGDVLVGKNLYSLDPCRIGTSKVRNTPILSEIGALTNFRVYDVISGEKLTSSVQIGDFLSPLPIPQSNALYIDIISPDKLSIPITVTVFDDEAPVLESDMLELTIERGSEPPDTFTELFGVRANDLVDGDMTENIVYDRIVSDVDFNVSAQYSVMAYVSDEAGNEAIPLLLKLTITDPTPIPQDQELHVISEESSSTPDYRSPETGDGHSSISLIFIIACAFGIIVLFRKLLSAEKS